MNKRLKYSLISFVAFMFISIISLGSTSFAAKAWDGKTIDVSWFDSSKYETTQEYEISTPEQLMGLAAIVNGIYNPEITNVIGDDGTKIVKDGLENVLIIPFDNTYGNVLWGKYDFEGKTIKLTADLDMGGRYSESTGWDPNSPSYMPIGGAYSMVPTDSNRTLLSATFNGNFDGQGHRVDNIYFSREKTTHFGYSQGLGLIGSMGTNDKKNKKLESEGKPVVVPKAGSVKNVIVGKGYMYGRRMTGGIVGSVKSSKGGIQILNCANYADVYGTDKKGIGGIVGALWDADASVKYCYNRGNITNTGGFIVGGIVGSLEGTVSHCYNTGIVRSYDRMNNNIESISEAADIAKVSDDTTAKGYRCYWELNDTNRSIPKNGNKSNMIPRAGVSYYYDELGVECSGLEKSVMMSDESVKKLNADLHFYTRGKDGYPALLIEGDTNEVNVTVVNPENGKVTASNVGKVNKGTAVTLKAEFPLGYTVDYFTSNGKRIEGDTLVALEDIEVSAVSRKLKSQKINIPEDPDFKLFLTKDGVIEENGKFSKVEGYEVNQGDDIYEGDTLYISSKVSEVNIKNLQIKVEGAKAKRIPGRDDVSYIVTGLEPLKITATKEEQADNWTKYANTDWYDRNPDASEFVIQNHYELAGLSKIMNSTQGKYKDENFSGKKIKLKQDLRLRNDKNLFVGDNVLWIPIGSAKPFAGEFDGQGNRISGVQIDDDISMKAGLFAEVKGTSAKRAVIKNLSVDGNIVLKKGYDSVGGIAGASDYADFQNVKSYVTINCERSSDIGGIVGSADHTNIDSAENYGNIDTKKGNAGGIAGATAAASNLKNLKNYADIYQGPLANTIKPFTSGGVVGMSKGALSNAVNKGRVTGYYWTGGVAGCIQQQLKNSYSTGEVYSVGSFESESSLGTLVGNVRRKGDSIANSYTTGLLKGLLNLTVYEGFAPLKSNGAVYKNSYYLENTLGSDFVEAEGVSALSDLAMKADSFVSTLNSEAFSKDIYNINNGYPVLNFENDLVSNTSIEKLVAQAKNEIISYPKKEYYSDEVYSEIKALIDQYLPKFDPYITNPQDNKQTRIDIRKIVNDFKAEVDKKKKISVDEDKLKRENLISILEKGTEELKLRLADKKVPETAAKNDAKKVLKEAQDMIKSIDSAEDIQIEMMAKKVFKATAENPLDNEAPKIYGVSDVTIRTGSSFDLRAGVTVEDSYPGAPAPVLKEILGENSFTSDKPGKYTLTYIAEDSVGNKAEKKRIITVEGKPDEGYDFDGDGKTDYSDLVYLNKRVANKLPYDKWYDLNGDKQVDYSDSLVLFKYIAKHP